jgi:phosphatidylserine/phosphatidylglycerophosphate/cardiolipin synthase-like enzyme
MLALSSTDALLAAIRGAHTVAFSAYALHPGRVLDALESAARDGVRVSVRVERAPYKDDAGARENGRVLVALRSAGADARATDGLHLKAAVIDSAVFLDDRNWADDGADTIVRDDFAGDARVVRDALAGRTDPPSPFFATRKADALAEEARLLYHARAGEDVIVETESFGFGRQIYAALSVIARQGRTVRLLVAARDLHDSPIESKAIADLRRAGVSVRVCDSDEKFALAGDRRAWLGSANATQGVPDQRDWGMRTDNPAIVAHLRAAFESRWTAAEGP